MDPSFWHSRWAEGRIGFHQSDVTPLLAEFWTYPSGGCVFVPLCGKSLDMVWLASRGHRVLGVELSALAVEQFFSENFPSSVPSIVATTYGEEWTVGPITIIVGDAFELSLERLAECSYVYDRAAIIALPIELRERYAGLFTLLPSECAGLMITLEYPSSEKAGPPFSVVELEVRVLFRSSWSVEMLARRDILASQPSFVAEGVSSLATVAYSLARGRV